MSDGSKSPGVTPKTRLVQSTKTNLSQRNYKKICVLSFIVFAIAYISLGINRQFSTAPLCPYELELKSWVRDWNVAAAGGMLVAIAVQINRILLSTFREDNDIGTLSSYYASFVVNVMCAITHLGALFFGWGGMCRDPFGVYTPAGIWVEWSLAVPLIAFITLSVDDKPFLPNEDIASVISLHLCILCGAIIQADVGQMWGAILLLASCIFCLPCFYMVWRSSKELDDLLTMSMGNEKKRGLYQRRILLASRKATLSICLGYLFPVFPMLYFLRNGQIIDDSFYVGALMFASSFTKIMFSSLCMDAHLEVSHPSFALIDAENFSNTSRRAFLRYVFHEVRVPLNAISLGVQVLDTSNNLDSEDRSTVSMVREAVTFMGETLNDVMALQKVEEGSMELIYKSFSIQDLFQNVEDSFIDISVEYEVALSTQIDKNVPQRVIGDKFRIRHVLANLVSNALKYSTTGGLVQLKASIMEALPVEDIVAPIVDTGNFVYVVFAVADEGRGISQEDQEDDIFMPYRQLKHGELKEGRGTGLGLAICKEIVRMHGGKIWYTSQLGVGSTFYVALPLEVSSMVKSPSWQSSQRRSFRRLRKSTMMTSHMNVLMSHGADDVNTPVSSNRNSRSGLAPFSPSPAGSRPVSGTSSLDHGSPASAFGIALSPSITGSTLVRRYSSDTATGVTPTSLARSQLLFTSGNSVSEMQKSQDRSISSSTSFHNDEDLHRVGLDSDTDDSIGSRHDVESFEEGSMISLFSSNKCNKLRRRQRTNTGPEASACTPPSLRMRSTSSPAKRSRSVSIASSPFDKNENNNGRLAKESIGGIEIEIPELTSPADCYSKNSHDAASTAFSTPPLSARRQNSNSKPPLPSTSQSPMPALISPEKTTNRTKLNSPPVLGNNQRFGFLNILIVDDVNSNRKLLALLLNKKGIHSISFAEDGRQAVDAIQNRGSEAFDLIFMDNTMPKMTGIEASRLMRRFGYENLIVGVTGNSMEDELNDFMLAGADMVITKPMKPHVLDSLLTFTSTYGCRSRSDQRLAVLGTELQWVNSPNPANAPGNTRGGGSNRSQSCFL